MTNSNLKSLSKIPIILQIKKLALNDKIKKELGQDKTSTAQLNSKKIFAYQIVYKSQGHKVVGFILEPRKGNHLPCIIWNRGGSKEFGAIKLENIFVNSMSEFAKAGYIVIASQYSGNGGSEGYDEQGGTDIEDVLNLYKILKSYPRANTSKIGMYGSSRGGIMTFLTLTKVKWLKAAVVRAPVTNLFHQIKKQPQVQSLYKSMFGGSVAEYKKRSVIYWVEKLYKKAPILLMHGTSDWRVDVQDTLDLGRRFYQENIPYRLIIYEGDDHGLTNNNGEAVFQSITWFNRFLKYQEPLPNLKPHGK